MNYTIEITKFPERSRFRLLDNEIKAWFKIDKPSSEDFPGEVYRGKIFSITKIDHLISQIKFSEEGFVTFNLISESVDIGKRKFVLFNNYSGEIILTDEDHPEGIYN